MPSVVTGRFPLSRSALARRVALADAEREYDVAMARAAAQAAIRIRAAEVSWRTARDRARSVAAARRETWKGYRAAVTPDLRMALLRNEFALTSWSRPWSVPADLESARWHVRVLRSELSRRGELL